MKDIIEKVLESAVLAPSGENCQPWKFSITGNQIFIFNVPESDTSPYNFRQNGSLVAHGALLENISIASSALGYKTKISLFPDQMKSDLVAIATLEKSSPTDENLFLYIDKRATNRKTYKNTFLTADQKNNLLNVADEIGQGKIILIEDAKQRDIVGQAVSVTDTFLFENKAMHDYFFSNIVWTEGEEKEKRHGLYIKTLELPPPVQAAFKLFKHWPVAKILTIIGFPKVVAKGNAKIYSSGAATGIIVVDNNNPVDFVVAGRLMQRVWLRATKMGLSLQPVTGVLFLMQRVIAGDTENFSTLHINLLKDAYEKIKTVFGVKSGTIAMLFRIGEGDKPSAYSSRLPPRITQNNI